MQGIGPVFEIAQAAEDSAALSGEAFDVTAGENPKEVLGRFDEFACVP